MGGVFFFAFLASLYPTLLAAVTVMLLLPNPKRMLLGYLLGAYMTSITLGLVIVFALEGTGAESTAKHTLAPAADFALGAILLIVAFVIGSEGGRERAARRREQREAKRKGEDREPLPQRLLSRGSSRIAFVAGALLTLPGVSYLTALHRLDELELATAPTVLTVIAINVVMLMLLELPLLGFVIAPERTRAAVHGLREWLSSHGRDAAARGAAIIGGLLILRGIIEVL
jgi:hypothetical protein